MDNRFEDDRDSVNRDLNRAATGKTNDPIHHDDHPDTGDVIGEAAGGISGVLTGAALGSLGGPIGTIIGGIAGGLIGHQFGSGSGNTAATIAGTIGGAAVGSEVARRQGDGRVERCRTISDYSERVIGYDVTYRFQGREFATRLPYDPGPRLPVHVTVAPAR
jgi:uncharacterized protein YcfJ